jgi:hypothetical protein
MKLKLFSITGFITILTSFSLQAFPVTTTNNFGPESATASQQIFNAVQPVNNPAFASAGAINNITTRLSSSSHASRGLELKNPVVAPAFTYRTINDEAPGGFDGDELSGDIAFDAEVYNGLIAGILYGHTYRSSQNNLNTDEHMDSNAVSVYAAKRLFDLVNVGAAYNFATTDHRLSRAVVANLDRDSHGFTIFAGASSRKDKWSWGTTFSFGYVDDDYDQQKDLETGRFGWNGNVGYDFTKKLTIAAVLNYYDLVIQDRFPNTDIRDDDYWTIGPRITYYATERVTLHADFDSQFGYNDFSSHTLRVGADIAF